MSPPAATSRSIPIPSARMWTSTSAPTPSEMRIARAERDGLRVRVPWRFKSGPVVRVIYNDRLMTSKVFEARLPVPPSGVAWQAASLPLSAFQAEDGKCPEAWKGAQKLEIKGVASRSEPPCFRGFRWAKPLESPSKPQ